MTTQNSFPSVTLKCIKEGSRLRVRITSPGYYHDANCQFPRDIRLVGRSYECPASDVTLAKGPRGKYFYRINKKGIKVLDSEKPSEKVSLKVYGDDDSDECLICMDQTKDVVFAPCGHFCSCGGCAQLLLATTSSSTSSSTCPLCRTAISVVVERKNIT